MLFVYVFCL